MNIKIAQLRIGWVAFLATGAIPEPAVAATGSPAGEEFASASGVNPRYDPCPIVGTGSFMFTRLPKNREPTAPNIDWSLPPWGLIAGRRGTPLRRVWTLLRMKAI